MSADFLTKAADAVAALDLVLADWLETIDGDVHASLQLLREVRAIKRDLATIENAVEAHCAGVMPEKVFQADDMTATRSTTARTTWDDRALAGQLIAAHALIDDGTGEVDDERYRASWELVDALLAAAHVDYWRSTNLKAIGIDPEQFRTREWGRRTVRIQPPARRSRA